jgi:hypothetical protein
MLEKLQHISFTLEHNPHKGYYDSVEDYLDFREFDDEEILPEDKEEAIRTDELWTLQWYPRTPVVFYVMVSSTYEKLMQRVDEFMKDK